MYNRIGGAGKTYDPVLAADCLLEYRQGLDSTKARAGAMLHARALNAR